jgi:sigma-B regulation protein RsbU (phosphoserine phosphatase)
MDERSDAIPDAVRSSPVQVRPDVIAAAAAAIGPAPNATGQTPTAGGIPSTGESHVARRLAADAATGPLWGTRLRDFVTDGSVAGLCDEMSLLLGVPIWLRDQNGEVIIPEATLRPGSDSADKYPWSIVSEKVGRARAQQRVGWFEPDSDAPARSEVFTVPLKISTGTLGAIAACLPVEPPAGGADASGTKHAHRLAHIKRSLQLLASSVCDVCEAQVALSKRVRELDALFRLSSLLSAAAEPDDLLGVALDLAMEVLRVDAGSIAVIEDGPGGGGPDGRGPVMKAHRGLSDGWVNSTMPLSRGGLLRQAALAGEAIAVEDLSTDSRIADHERIRSEGLCSLLTTGLLDQGRPIGLVRLYTKRPRVFTESEGELLRAIADHAASAVTSARLRSLRAQDEAMKRQVRLAASVQRRMLPRTLPKIKPFEVAAHYAPSFDLGGDFYDFLELGGHLGILIGDVVGKGVPAALLMSSVRASLRAHAQGVYHIDEVLSRVNKALVRDTLDNEFATVWYGVADPQTLRLTYCSAGHDWPLLVHVPKDRKVEEKDLERLTADGMALGIDETQKYPKGMFQLRERDVVIAFTDGVHDATNFEGKRFGGTRLRNAVLDLLREEPEASPSRVVDHVLAVLRQYTGMSGRGDDMTLVVMRVGERGK